MDDVLVIGGYQQDQRWLDEQPRLRGLPSDDPTLGYPEDSGPQRTGAATAVRIASNTHREKGLAWISVLEHHANA